MRIKYFIVFLFTALFTLPVRAQGQLPNLVPNASFEDLSNITDKWFYKGRHYTEVMKYWTSPLNTSPDAYGPEIYVPNDWREKGFGKQQAYEGEGMSGITLYGCKKGKPHCREYLQIQLSEALVVGQTYSISFWASSLDCGLRVNNMAVAFSTEEIEDQFAEHLNLNPAIDQSDILMTNVDQWLQVKGSWVADSAYSYLILGNFRKDSETATQGFCDKQFGYAYYYIDNVEIRKVPPILAAPVQPVLLENRLQVGSIIDLENIYFDLNKADFMPRSFEELDALLITLKNHPGLEIEVQGHTDNQGDPDYNKWLSNNRAKAVVDYLSSQGIAPYRLTYKGFGSELPLGDNRTIQGRKKNRRVAFLVRRY